MSEILNNLGKTMNKAILILSVSFCLSFWFQSCKKDSTQEPDTKTIDVALKVNQSYQFNLGGFGIEEGAGIATQALHFLISIAYRDSSGTTPNIFYKYIPATNFVGKDEVTINSEKGSNGGNANTKITYTTIKFIISN